LTSRSWSEALGVYGRRPVLSMLFLGFSAGLPFYLVFQTLSAIDTKRLRPAARGQSA
jgi:PAT family beta-lactamase induction signal transducer AmpG